MVKEKSKGAGIGGVWHNVVCEYYDGTWWKR